jgi:hypothetical protein
MNGSLDRQLRSQHSVPPLIELTSPLRKPYRSRRHARNDTRLYGTGPDNGAAAAGIAQNEAIMTKCVSLFPGRAAVWGISPSEWLQREFA